MINYHKSKNYYSIIKGKIYNKLRINRDVFYFHVAQEESYLSDNKDASLDNNLTELADRINPLFISYY